MTHNPWGNYKHSPIAIRILSWLCIPALLFFLAHTIIQFVYADDIIFSPWIGELYTIVWLATPLFLYLTGSMIANKKMRIVTNVCLVVFGSCYLLNLGNAYEWVDIPHLQYPMSVALLVILTTWIIHVVRRPKNILDLFKFIWLVGLTYSFIAPKFIPHNHEAGNFYFASLFIFPVMMIIGLYKFFPNKNHSHEQQT